MDWLLITCIASISLLSLLTWRRYFSAISDIPGPFATSSTRLWQMHRILKGDQNLALIRLHEQHGHFVRISYDEVSVSHPDAIAEILLAPLHKVNRYKIHALPDYRFQSPMSITDPKKKAEKSKHIAAAYTVSNLLRSEEHVDRTLESFLDWMDKYATDKKPMNLNTFISEQGKHIGRSTENSRALNAYMAVAGYSQWINIALLANQIMTQLSIQPMGHLFDTVKSVLADREKNRNVRYDAVQYWLKRA